MQVKVCGMRDPDNIREVAALAPDFMGFIFYPPSPRYCGDLPKDAVRNLPDSILPVAVTVDMDYDSILGLVEHYGFRGVQLHGNETPELCRKLKSAGLFVIKAISVKDAESLSKVDSYSDSVDLLVLDTATKSKGGSGKKFDWDLLKNADIKVDFLLSGGIGPDDAKELLNLKHPHMVGVDLNSRFEISPGVKSVSKLKKFQISFFNMNRLKSLLIEKKHNLLSVYFTAGFPKLDSTVDVINALCSMGVDMIEVGIPFSDPMADGVVIQHSGGVALKNGMTLRLLLSQVEEARKQNPDTPFIAMGYLNPIMQMGVENFFKRAKEVGIDAVIIPDLPFDVYNKEYKEISERYDVAVIMLITPETSEERIRLIDENCDGFIYMVSAASTTGARDRFDENQIEYFKRINSLNLNHARLIGFGISNERTYDEACRYSNGAIIGSQFIKCLESASSPAEAVDTLLAKIGR